MAQGIQGSGGRPGHRTAKVMAVVAEVMADGALRVAGLGIAASHGLKRGVVVNIDATVQSIQQALKRPR